jgi:hypothetical protein
MAGEMFADLLGFTSNWEAFASQNFYGTIERKLVSSQEDFGIMLVALVRQNTPIDQGALWASIQWGPDPIDEQGIVMVFANPAEQMAEWNRVYVAYQEGGALGKPTYTNAPHEMFAKALDQVDTIMTLATRMSDSSLNRLSQNLGDY